MVASDGGNLRFVLPGLYWPGFRRVRGQVCKRLCRRLRDLGLDNFIAYQAKLEGDPTEWRLLDQCCHITISRFFRDRTVFELLRTPRVLPDIAACAAREDRNAEVWSVGCASGEEPYTIKILWDVEVARAFKPYQSGSPPQMSTGRCWHVREKDASSRQACTNCLACLSSAALSRVAPCTA